MQSPNNYREASHILKQFGIGINGGDYNDVTPYDPYSNNNLPVKRDAVQIRPGISHAKKRILKKKRKLKHRSRSRSKRRSRSRSRSKRRSRSRSRSRRRKRSRRRSRSRRPRRLKKRKRSKRRSRRRSELYRTEPNRTKKQRSLAKKINNEVKNVSSMFS